MNTLIVIAHHNGSKYIGNLMKSLKEYRYETMVVDTGSTPEELESLRNVVGGDVNVYPNAYCTGAYLYAYLVSDPIKFDSFFFMHDSMSPKCDFLPDFQKRGEVVAWIGFPMDYGQQEKEFLSKFYDLSNAGPTAVFGPIFYATRRAMRKIDSFPPVTNRIEMCAMERGVGIDFHRAGYKVEFLEPYDNERIDVKRDYKYFDKYRPNRP